MGRGVAYASLGPLVVDAPPGQQAAAARAWARGLGRSRVRVAALLATHEPPAIDVGSLIDPLGGSALATVGALARSEVPASPVAPAGRLPARARQRRRAIVATARRGVLLARDAESKRVMRVPTTSGSRGARHGVEPGAPANHCAPPAGEPPSGRQAAGPLSGPAAPAEARADDAGTLARPHGRERRWPGSPGSPPTRRTAPAAGTRRRADGRSWLDASASAPRSAASSPDAVLPGSDGAGPRSVGGVPGSSGAPSRSAGFAPASGAGASAGSPAELGTFAARAWADGVTTPSASAASAGSPAKLDTFATRAWADAVTATSASAGPRSEAAPGTAGAESQRDDVVRHARLRGAGVGPTAPVGPSRAAAQSRVAPGPSIPTSRSDHLVASPGTSSASQGGDAVSRALRRASRISGAPPPSSRRAPAISPETSGIPSRATVRAWTERVWASPSPHEHGTDGPGRSKQTQAPGAPPQPPGEPEIAQRLARTVESLEAVQGRLADLGRGSAPDVHWLEDDDELAGRLQRVLGRQARARGIELS